MKIRAPQAFAQKHGIDHRIVEQMGLQVILVKDDSLRQKLIEDYQAFIEGRLSIKLQRRQMPDRRLALLQFLKH
mgnify:CR=1 FL=1